MKLRYWFVTVCLLILCGCQTSSSEPKHPARTLRTCLGGEILSLDPRKGVSMSNQGVVRMLFAGLVRLDENLKPRLELAESFRASPDSKTYVFTLKNCTWSDGSPITAHDFEQTWKAALTPAYSSSCTNLFFFLKNGRKAFLGQLSVDQLGVQALDEKTLMVELEHANPNFLSILIHSIFSPVHHTMRYSLPDSSNLICSGPFQLKGYTIQDQIILSKNSHYWNSSCTRLDELHFYIVKDPLTALMMFEKKEIDWLGEPLARLVPESIPTLRKKGILHSYPTAGLQWMFVNTNKYPLNNAHIRKALAYAIDRKTIMQEILNFEGLDPTLGLIPQIVKKERWHPWFKDNDVEQARVLFEKGLQEQQMTKEQFPLITLIYGASAYAKAVHAIQQI